MVTKVTAPNIQGGVSTGLDARSLINDLKRAVNESIDSATDAPQDGNTHGRKDGGWVPIPLAVGPTVVKDWTTVTSLSSEINLLNGVTLPNGNMNNLRLEIRDFSISSIYGGGAFLGIIPRRTGNSEVSVTSNMRYERFDIVSGVTSSQINGVSSLRNGSLFSSNGRQTATIDVDIITTAIVDNTVVRESLGLTWDSVCINNNTSNNNGSTARVRGSLNVFSALVSGAPIFTELWLVPANISGTVFTIDSFKYRLVDTSV